MSQLINGKEIAEKIKDSIVAEILTFKGKRPNLAIILIGDREDSKLYVSLKEKEAVRVGIDTHVYRCVDTTPESEILKMIECLNNDDLIDAILVQLPLSDVFDTDKIIKAIDPKKDVDRFHPDNLKKLFESCSHEEVLPPVLKVVLEMLKETTLDLKDKQICIIANSDIFGKSLAHVLECRGAKTLCTEIDDKDLSVKTLNADVLISAVGSPHFIKKEMVKKDSVIIDIGISKQDGKVMGDVDFDDVEDKVAFITPVPGGVGPMTIAMLFLNTLELFKKRL